MFMQAKNISEEIAARETMLSSRKNIPRNTNYLMAICENETVEQ